MNVNRLLVPLVPAEAGTHTPQQRDVAGPSDNRNLGDYGSRLRGDDSGWFVPRALGHAGFPLSRE
jgi:hypothetical protein